MMRRGALRHRDFRVLMAGQAVSLIGDRLFPIALAFAVLDELDGSPSELSLVLAAQLVPLALLVLPAGVWADRVDRRALMLASDLGRAAAQAGVAFLLITGEAELWHLAALAAVYGGFEAVFRPAAGGLTPRLVAPEELQQANAIYGVVQSVSFVLGPALAGVLIAAVGTGTTIALDAISFVVSAISLAFIRTRTGHHETTEPPHFVRELKEGVAEVWQRPWLRAGMAILLGYHLVSLPCTLGLGPVVADRELGGAGAWAAISAAFGLGTVLGTAAALRVRVSRPMVATAGGFVFGALQPLFIVLGGGVVVISVLLAVAGAAIGFSFTVWETTIGQLVPDRALSRVTAMDYFTSTGLMPLGFALAGPAAEAFGLQATMTVAALATAGLAVAALTRPAIRGLRTQESVAS